MADPALKFERLDLVLDNSVVHRWEPSPRRVGILRSRCGITAQRGWLDKPGSGVRWCRRCLPSVKRDAEADG